MQTKMKVLPIKISPIAVIMLLAFWIHVIYPDKLYTQEIANVDPDLQASQQNMAEVKVDGHFLTAFCKLSSCILSSASTN